jgi:hypothetical protein
MPNFSIVLTTTRPEWFSTAIRSVLWQTYQDFAVVVSDNTPNGIKNEVESIEDARVTYVRPSEYLTVTEHWNFAFSHATGDWQGLLCDDHAYIPSMLRIIKDEIDQCPTAASINFSFANFSGEFPISGQRPNRFWIPEYSNKRTLYDTQDLVAEMFDKIPNRGETKKKIPQITNSFYSRKCIERVREINNGNLFSPLDPLASSSMLILALSEKTLRLFFPLVVFGNPVESAGNHKLAKKVFQKMNQGSEFRFSPIPSLHVFPSALAETMLRVRNRHPELFDSYQLNTINLFRACRDSILELADQFGESRDEQALYDSAYSRLSESEQLEIERVRPNLKRRPLISRIIGRVVSKVRMITALVQRAPRTVEQRTLNTKKLGIATILDCGVVLDNEISQTYRQKRN